MPDAGVILNAGGPRAAPARRRAEAALRYERLYSRREANLNALYSWQRIRCQQGRLEDGIALAHKAPFRSSRA